MGHVNDVGPDVNNFWNNDSSTDFDIILHTPHISANSMPWIVETLVKFSITFFDTIIALKLLLALTESLKNYCKFCDSYWNNN